jgi:hypothetical protein
LGLSFWAIRSMVLGMKEFSDPIYIDRVELRSLIAERDNHWAMLKEAMKILVHIQTNEWQKLDWQTIEENTGELLAYCKNQTERHEV